MEGQKAPMYIMIEWNERELIIGNTKYEDTTRLLDGDTYEIQWNINVETE